MEDRARWVKEQPGDDPANRGPPRRGRRAMARAMDRMARERVASCAHTRHQEVFDMQRLGLILFAALLGLSFSCNAAHAQGLGTITGRVLDADTGQGIAGAAVIVKPAGKRTTSGADGSFTIAGLGASSFSVKCQKAGYQAAGAVPKVRLSAGQTAAIECRLRAAALQGKKDEAAGAGRGRSGSRDRATRAPDSKEPPAELADMPAAPRREAARRPAPSRAKLGAVGHGAGAGHGIAAGAVSQPLIVTQPGPQPESGEFNTEEYRAIDENPFEAATHKPLSTFSIDVDTASYSNVRRYLSARQMPPRDAVKIEELINYFSYEYPSPTGADPFAVHTEVSVAPWNQAHRLVKIGLQGKRIAMDALPPSNLVFLIDVSGSMNSPDKLPLLKAAFKLLVQNLRPRDRVAIVVYAGAAGLVLPSTPGTDKDTILAAIDRLEAGGSTAGGAGIRLAYDVARQSYLRGGNNRVILATDGDFNVGASSDADMVQLIEEKRKEGVFLTVLGFGTGNYKDGKMEQLADRGNGNHAYIDSLLEAKKVLVSEMGGTLFTIAKDVKLQIEFNPARVKAYRLIGYENRMLQAQDFNDDKKDAGELGSGHTVTALYEIIPAGSDEAVAGVDALKYQQTQATAAATTDELMTVKLRYKLPDGDKSKLLSHAVRDASTPLDKTSADFRFATAVAEFGMLLRSSEHKGKASYEAVLERAQGALGADREGYRKEFLLMVGQTKLMGQQVAR
jgi:Ca-activated chloride channel family protein